MNEATHNVVPAPADTLHAELRSLIASSRQRLAGAVNAELTRLYWSVGQRLRTEVLGDARAGYRGETGVRLSWRYLKLLQRQYLITSLLARDGQ